MNEATEGRAFASVEDPKHPWLKARLAGIGGSDVGAIMGVDPYTSAFNLYGQRVGLVEPPAMNRFMYWGSVLEPVIADWYRSETGRRVIKAERVARVLRGESESKFDGIGPYATAIADVISDFAHVEYGPDSDGRVIFRSKAASCNHMLFTPDFFIIDKDEGMGLLEVKTGDSRTKKNWAEGAPAHYMCQLQAGMRVFGFDWGAFAVLFGGNDAGDYDVNVDNELGIAIASETAKFWDRIHQNDPPPVDGSTSTLDALKQIYPQGSGDSVAIEVDDAYLVDLYEDYKETASAATKGKKKAETIIRGLLGSHTRGTLPDGRSVYLTDIGESQVAATTRKGYRRFGVTKAKKR